MICPIKITRYTRYAIGVEQRGKDPLRTVLILSGARESRLY